MAMHLYLFICHPNPIPKQPSSYYNVAIFSPPFIFFGQGHFSSIFCGFQQQVLLVGLVFWTRGLPIFENLIIFHFTPFGGSLILLFTFCTLSILIYVTCYMNSESGQSNMGTLKSPKQVLLNFTNF